MADLSTVAAQDLVRRHFGAGPSLLDVLHAIQDEAGYIPPEVLTPLAQAMNLSRAEVHGVVTYYHHFRTAPPPRVVVQLCRAEACRSMGTEQLAAHIEQRTGCRFDSHGAHGAAGAAAVDGHPAVPVGAMSGIGLESVYCLGQCALSPAMFINDSLHAKVTPERFDRLLEAAQADAAGANA